MRLKTAIASFLEGYFSTCQRSPKTIQAYSLDLRQFCEFAGAWKRLENLGPEILERWAALLREGGYSSASIRRKFASLKVFFHYWTRRGEIRSSPASQLRLDLAPEVRLPKVLSLEDVQRLLAQARREVGRVPKRLRQASDPTFLALRNLAIVELLFATGIRVGELTSLRVGDIDNQRRQFVINGKGSRQRVAMLLDDSSHGAVTRYRKYRLALPADTDALFINLFGDALSTQGVAYNLSRLAVAAKIETRVTPHVIRHTIATLLLRHGADIRVVQEFLGHASIVTTQRYTHISRKQLERTLRTCHPNLLSGLE